VRRVPMIIFIITMVISGIDIGYSINVGATTIGIILKEIFPIHDTKVALLSLQLSFFIGCVIGCVWGGK